MFCGSVNSALPARDEDYDAARDRPIAVRNKNVDGRTDLTIPSEKPSNLCTWVQ
jgi:hypothetical protein